MRSLLAGIVLGIVALELLLRLTGAGIAAWDRWGRRTAAETPADLTILALGACYTVGLGADPQESWPSWMERLLAERFPGRTVRVYNGGVRSKGIDYFAARIEPLLDQFRPDILVVNVNDRVLYQRGRVGEGWLPVPLAEALSNLRVWRMAVLLQGPPAPTMAASDPGPGAEAHTLAIQQARAATQAYPDDPRRWVARWSPPTASATAAAARRARVRPAHRGHGAGGGVSARVGARRTTIMTARTPTYGPSQRR